MSRFYSYINTAKKIIAAYKGEKPFAIFVKQFFAGNKKYGAKDRRQITSLCYNYFRLGFAAGNLDMEEKMLLGFFLCEQQSTDLMQRFKPELNKDIGEPLKKKLALTHNQFAVTEIFPFADELSKGINVYEYCRSLLVQPNIFMRIRSQTKMTALKKLERSKLPYKIIGNDVVQLPPGASLEDFFIIDKEVVIQDYNSQQVLNFIKKQHIQNRLVAGKAKPVVAAWDCCAASGGKSILLSDIFHNRLDLTVSDIRAKIVLNLHKRFKKAGIKEYKYFIADIGHADFIPLSSKFDLIVCDVPCTGSGTWSRAPEQLCFFKKESIADYSTLQQNIVAHVLPYLHAGGLLVYITCSVFIMENEMMADHIVEKFNCNLLHYKLLKGYNSKADSMYVAVFEKIITFKYQR